MANFTQKAIKESFLKLLNEKPLSRISVRDIVEDCGINRNSFYYHFRDIPTLLEEIIVEEMNGIIEKYPTVTSLDECFDAAFSFAVEHKKAAAHIFNSVSRDVFERELMKLCTYAITAYVDTAFAQQQIRPEDRRIFIHFIKCECFGLMIDWLGSNMEDAAIVDLHRLTELCRGLSQQLICRSLEK